MSCGSVPGFQKNAGEGFAPREPIIEMAGNDQEAVAPGDHISDPQPAELKSHRIAKFSASAFLNYFRGIKQWNN